MKHHFLKWLLLAACALQLSGQVGNEIGGFFPDIAGWKLKEPPLQFFPENLYEYIDGAAENFLAYEFQALQVAGYENGAKKSLTIEIYRHSSPRNCFGIYSSEKPLKGNFLAIGSEGYHEEGVLNFYFGSYYVKINAYELGASEQSILVDAARGIAARMGRQQGAPAELAFFPPEGLVANSERFILKNFLGHPFLGNAFRAEYERGGARFQVFLILARDRQEAAGIVKKWREASEKKPASDAPEGAVEFTDPYNGKVLAEWRGGFLFGLVKYPEGEKAGLMAEMQKSADRLKR